MGPVMAAFRHKYRVDGVPLLLQPFFLAYGYGIGMIGSFYFNFVRATSSVEIINAPNTTSKGHILCVWHQMVAPYYCCVGRHTKHVWMNHPSWYMKPIHVVIMSSGVERLILGSTGNSGRMAAEALVAALKDGYSTVMFPDGPYGPPQVLKKGVFHMAHQSGCPLVPVKFEVSSALHIKKSWDQKLIPLPFSTLRMVHGEPVHVASEEDFDAAIKRVASQMGTSESNS
jgi:lysophospholipid acyltransferase (LPLAT)-like uncharacterized protein